LRKPEEEEKEEQEEDEEEEEEEGAAPLCTPTGRKPSTCPPTKTPSSFQAVRVELDRTNDSFGPHPLALPISAIKPT
jgi:hypothetical protein